MNRTTPAVPGPYTALVRVSLLHNIRYSSHPWPTIRAPHRFSRVNLTSFAVTMRSPLRWRNSGLDFSQERRTSVWVHTLSGWRDIGERWIYTQIRIFRNNSVPIRDTELHENFEAPLGQANFTRNLLGKIQKRERMRSTQFLLKHWPLMFFPTLLLLRINLQYSVFTRNTHLSY